MTEQPMPTPGGQAVTPVAADLFHRMLTARAVKGLKTYGQPLQTENGRDAVQDAMEEALDLWQYLVQIKLERDTAIAVAVNTTQPAETVTVDRASLTAHNLEKWEQIDQLQRAAAASEQRAAALDYRLSEIRNGSQAYRYWRTNDDVLMYSCRFCPSPVEAVGRDGDHQHHRICVLNPDYEAGMQAVRERLAAAAPSAAAPGAAGTEARDGEDIDDIRYLAESYSGLQYVVTDPTKQWPWGSVPAVNEIVDIVRAMPDLLARSAAMETERGALRAALETAEQVIADVQFDLINCHQQNACAHIQDALMIVNRHGDALAAAAPSAAPEGA